jgi:hypothetical protein
MNYLDEFFLWSSIFPLTHHVISLSAQSLETCSI